MLLLPMPVSGNNDIYVDFYTNWPKLYRNKRILQWYVKNVQLLNVKLLVHHVTSGLLKANQLNTN